MYEYHVISDLMQNIKIVQMKTCYYIKKVVQSYYCIESLI